MITTQELCNILKVSKQMVMKLRNEGMPCVLIGNGFRYEWEEVKKWLEEKEQIKRAKRRKKQ